MTRREIKLCKVALTALHEADGGQLTEVVLHGRMTELLGEHVSLGDFTATVATLDTRGWCTVVPSEFKGKVRKNNARGEAALEEMQ